MNRTTPLPTLLGLTSALALAAWLAPLAPSTSLDAEEIDDLPYTISAPGSYRVIQNLTGDAGASGIFVECDDVSIDLGGFVLEGVPGSFTAIEAAGRANVRVCNGSVAGWDQLGVIAGEGSHVRHVSVEGSTSGIRIGRLGTVEHCFVRGCTDSGIFASNQATVADCRVEALSPVLTDVGVRVLDGCVVERVQVRGAEISLAGDDNVRIADCVVTRFTECGFELGDAALVSGSQVVGTIGSFIGIDLGERGRIRDCTLGPDLVTGLVGDPHTDVRTTSIAGVQQIGMVLGRSSTVADCTVADAGNVAVLVEDGSSVCSVSVSGGGTGIAATSQGTVTGCRVVETAEQGIRLGNDSVATGNVVVRCGGAGIQVDGDRARVTDNTLNGNGQGLLLVGEHSLVTGNRAVDSAGADFTLPFPNTFGPTLNSAWSIQGSAPQANFRTP